jgi:hypothetical protein
MRVFLAFAVVNTAAVALTLLLASSFPATAKVLHVGCQAAKWEPNGAHGITCCAGGGGSCLDKQCPLGLSAQAGWKWTYTGQRHCIN